MLFDDTHCILYNVYDSLRNQTTQKNVRRKMRNGNEIKILGNEYKRTESKEKNKLLDFSCDDNDPHHAGCFINQYVFSFYGYFFFLAEKIEKKWIFFS